jgi:hypothetical protein
MAYLEADDDDDDLKTITNLYKVIERTWYDICLLLIVECCN